MRINVSSREYTTLQSSGLSFVDNGNGLLFVYALNGMWIDYYPAANSWRIQGTVTRNAGYRSLRDFCRARYEESGRVLSR